MRKNVVKGYFSKNIRKFTVVAICLLCFSSISACGKDKEKSVDSESYGEESIEYTSVSEIQPEVTYEDISTEPSAEQVAYTLANCECDYSDDGVIVYTIGDLLNIGMSSYEITYLNYKEAFEAGYLSAPEEGTVEDYDFYVYYVIISGNVIPNLDISYYSVYEDEAIRALLIFDKEGNVTEAKTMHICSYLYATMAQMWNAGYR